MSVLRTVFLAIIFIIFFELGIIVSYTFVTSQTPDINNLINMQLNMLKPLHGIKEKIANVLRGPPENYVVENKIELINALRSAAKVDGIDTNTMIVVGYGAKIGKNVDLNITATGFKENMTNVGGEIIIKPGRKIPN